MRLNYLLPALLFLMPTLTCAQAKAPTLTSRLQRCADRNVDEEDKASVMNSAVLPSPDDVRTALPIILKMLGDKAAGQQEVALIALVGLQAAARAPQKQPPAYPITGDPIPGQTGAMIVGEDGPSAFTPEIARILTPAIPQIAAELKDFDTDNRVLAAAVLGGFYPNPPATVYPPLLAYLERQDALNLVGAQVFEDLYLLGPMSTDTAAAVDRFLHRPDMTGPDRAELQKIARDTVKRRNAKKSASGQ